MILGFISLMISVVAYIQPIALICGITLKNKTFFVGSLIETPVNFLSFNYFFLFINVLYTFLKLF